MRCGKATGSWFDGPARLKTTLVTVRLLCTFGPGVYRTELALALGLPMCPVNISDLFMTEVGNIRGPESTSMAITGPLALCEMVESLLSRVPRLLSSLSAVAE